MAAPDALHAYDLARVQLFSERRSRLAQLAHVDLRRSPLATLADLLNADGSVPPGDARITVRQKYEQYRSRVTAELEAAIARTPLPNANGNDKARKGIYWCSSCGETALVLPSLVSHACFAGAPASPRWTPTLADGTPVLHLDRHRTFVGEEILRTLSRIVPPLLADEVSFFEMNKLMAPDRPRPAVLPPHWMPARIAAKISIGSRLFAMRWIDLIEILSFCGDDANAFQAVCDSVALADNDTPELADWPVWRSKVATRQAATRPTTLKAAISASFPSFKSCGVEHQLREVVTPVGLDIDACHDRIAQALPLYEARQQRPPLPAASLPPPAARQEVKVWRCRICAPEPQPTLRRWRQTLQHQKDHHGPLIDVYGYDCHRDICEHSSRPLADRERAIRDAVRRRDQAQRDLDRLRLQV